jgi:outer membrane protein OmpA-like peptidoglycan-associated protein
MIFRFLFSLLITAILLTSCAKKITHLERLSVQESSLKTAGGYNSYLGLEYLDFSRNLAAAKKTRESEYFARKGAAASRDQFIAPEDPRKWNADPQQMEEMILMQKRLEMVLDTAHITFYLPIQTAHLTYLYDCWISRESQPIFRVSDLSYCKTRFYKLLDEMEKYVDDLKKDKQPKVEIKEPEFTRFEILFDLDSYKFNDKANKDLIALLDRLSDLSGNYRILIVGNADRTGNKLHNQNLALRRAEVVKNYLTKNGVPSELVEFRSLGEDFPDIITAQGVQQQLNRSVGIYVLKGQGSFSDYPLPLIEHWIYQEEIKRARQKRGLK